MIDYLRITIVEHKKNNSNVNPETLYAFLSNFIYTLEVFVPYADALIWTRVFIYFFFHIPK